MTFRGLFIGIDRYADARIDWLSGAVRDARAIHALFSDTVTDGSHVLLADEQATMAAIQHELQRLATESTADDVTVIYYAGHGSESHEIICYDTDVSNFSTSSLALRELGEALSTIPGETVFCALDCCFSGGLGNRVFATGLHERAIGEAAPTEELARFTSKGRLVFTASADDEPASESARHGHGLFTYRLIEALQGGGDVTVNGQVDLQKLVHYVSTRVTADAAQLGRSQTPTLRGQMDGTPLWPVLTAGPLYADLFPERVRQPATSDLSSLLEFGIPQRVIDAWAGRIPTLNDLQMRAINEFGVLDYENLVVSAPTSSGKTMIGELAAIHAASTRGRTVFLLPMKALVNDKYEHFCQIYGPAGIKTIRATGDYSDEVSALLKGQFDFALLTYEKFTALALGNPHVLDLVSVVVVDEAQTLTDRNRGSNLEFLLTMINNRRGRLGSPQVITLSAVVGDIAGLDRWLSAKHLHSEERPVPRREGVVDRTGSLRYIDESGDEKTTPNFFQPIVHSGNRSMVIPLVRRLVSENKKVIVFRETKSEAIATATYLSQSLGLSPADRVLESLALAEPSASTSALQRTLGGGVGFHMSDLDRTERQVLERAFGEEDSGLNVIVATPTLAMGINTPASAVVIVGLTHPTPPPTPYTVAEYKNMVGRAGRLGFQESGESYLVPTDSLDPFRGWSDYVLGSLEPLTSQLVPDNDPRTLMLRVLAQFQIGTVEGVRAQDVIDFLDSSFAAFQAREGRDPQWTTSRLTDGFDELVGASLVESTADGYRLTELGSFAGASGVHVDSIIKLSSILQGVDVKSIKSTGLIAAAQITNELDNVYISASMKKNSPELGKWSAVLQQQDVPYAILRGMQAATDVAGYVRRNKRALAIIQWINGVRMVDIERTLNQHIWNRPGMAGAVRQSSDRTRDLLPAVGAVLKQLYPDSAAAVAELVNRTLIRIEFGIAPPLIELAAAANGQLSRSQLLSLQAAGLAAPVQVLEAESEVLMPILGSQDAVDDLKSTCRDAMDRGSEIPELPKPTE